MRYFALACDYDGTIATLGQVASETVAALQKVATSGRKLVLVTGRILDELLEVFPEAVIFDRIVAENGAILYRPDTKQTKILGTAPPAEFLPALERENIQPLVVGQSIIATLRPNGAAVLKVIQQLGLELQVIYNKESLMILPTGINKKTGLSAALDELGISSHNTVAIGDAENDHALLKASGCGVAVANAISSLKDEADLITTEPNGSGVREAIGMLIENDLQNIPVRIDHKVLLGHDRTGKDVFLEPYGPSTAIMGPSGSGKSTVVHAIVERMLEKEYDVCVIDPEGDYEDTKGIITFGSSSRAPDVTEILKALQEPQISFAVNLLAVAVADRPQVFAEIFPKIQEVRSIKGRPNWVIIDEVHHLLPESWGQSPSMIPRQLNGVILVTVHVERLAPAILKSVGGVIAVGSSPDDTIRDFSKARGLKAPSRQKRVVKPREVLVWFLKDGNAPFSVSVEPATADMLRHKRKYAEGRLGTDRSFFFRGPANKLNLRAHNLMMFNQIAEGVDDETWLYHLQHADYSRWMKEAIKDDELAAEIRRVETNLKSDAKKSRQEIIEAVNKRYTASE